jgi:STE24 endopeptidase
LSVHGPGYTLAGVSDSEARARRYHRRQLVVSVAALVVTVLVLVAWAVSGLAAAVAAHAARWLPWPAAALLVTATAVGGSCVALTFPLEVAGGFLLPRRAGLLAQPFAGWLADQAKGWLVGGVLGLGAVEVIYALLRWSPAWWWLLAAAALAAGSLLLAAVVPVWLVPLFYRLTPLPDPAIRARLLALAARVGVAAADVSVADVSRKGRTANAAVVGLGRTRRILLSDTLLARFPADEIEVVLAHELAHHARGHLAQGLTLQALLLAGGLALAHLGLVRLAGPAGLTDLADPAGLPLLALLLTGAGLLATPLAAGWSRRLEREADRVALEVTRDPASFVAAMDRLAELNLAERRPHRWKQTLWATHPSIEQRIDGARRWAAHEA